MQAIFTHRRALPLGPMPALRLERAPLQAPEYRGVTPRAALHRAQRLQVALLAHYEAGIAPSVPPTVPDETMEHEPSQIRWTLASVLLILLLVIGAVVVI